MPLESLKKIFFKKKLLTFLSVFFLVFVDQITKYIFFDKKFLSETWIFEPIQNTGISFGIGVSYQIIFLVSLFALALFRYLLKKKYITNIVFVFFVAGTIGNLIDRAFFGFVKDWVVFLNLFIFNFADLCLSVGAFFVILNEFFLDHQK